jgi:hypothetical protein
MGEQQPLGPAPTITTCVRMVHISAARRSIEERPGSPGRDERGAGGAQPPGT